MYSNTHITNKGKSMQIIKVSGFWNDNKEPFVRTCAISESDDDEDEMDDDDDSDIFYYFSSDEKIVGEHLDFTITEIIPVDD